MVRALASLACLPALLAGTSPLGHRELLAARHGGRSADGLTTQRWVGAQSQDGVVVSEMSCTFKVPEDADIGTMPQKGNGEAHYIYCDLHHGWPGGVFGQFVPQLQRGMTTSAANSTTFKLHDTWLDGWYVQAQYIWSTPEPNRNVLGAVGELIEVQPGDTIATRIHYDEAAGAWELAIGAAPDASQLVAASTSTLSVTTPFFGTNPLFDSPFKGNSSCEDYHQFILGDLHEAWNMNSPDFYPKSQAWDVKYTSNDFANASGTNSCCKHVQDKCNKCPDGAVDVMDEAVETNEQGHIAFTVTRSSTDLAATASTSTVDPLYDSLAKVKFINSGTVTAADRFAWGITTSSRDPDTTAANAKAGKVLYLEKYNISGGGWGAGGAFPYLWKKKAAVTSSTCKVSATHPGMDMIGSDLVHGPSASVTACGNQCCAHAGCGGFAYITREADPQACGNTTAGLPGCCFLKPIKLPPLRNSTLKTIVAGIVAGAKPAPPPPSPPPPLGPVEDPPSGMRSAVPLGGISCGAVELRGDGSLHEFTWMNQSPGGSGKVQSYPDAYFAMRVGK
jgi:hypothetical protein